MGSQEQVVAKYTKMAAENPEGSKRLGYSTSQSQIVRFNAMLDLLLCGLQAPDLSALTVHDAGCGVGDMLGFLEGNGGLKYYAGTSIIEGDIELAQRRYSNRKSAQFKACDFSEVEVEADVTMVSGSFAFYPHDEVYEMIAKLMKSSKRALAFNLITDVNPPEGVVRFEPKDVFEFCQKLAPTLARHDYLPHDMTVVMLRRG